MKYVIRYKRSAYEELLQLPVSMQSTTYQKTLVPRVAKS